MCPSEYTAATGERFAVSAGFSVLVRLRILSSRKFQVSGWLLNQAESKSGFANNPQVCLGCRQSRTSNLRPASVAIRFSVSGLKLMHSGYTHPERGESFSLGRKVATRAPQLRRHSDTADNQPLMMSIPEWLNIDCAKAKSTDTLVSLSTSGESEKKNCGRLICSTASPISLLIPSFTSHSSGSIPKYLPLLR